MHAATAPLATMTARDLSARADGYAALVRRVKAVVRFMVGFSDPIAVVAGGDEDLLDLEGRRTFSYPPNPRRSEPLPLVNSSADAIAQLDSVRKRGARFLLFPATSFWWLDNYPGFREHLEANYRAVVRTGDCVLFSLLWPEDAEFRNAGAPDGLPLPPPELIRITVSNPDAERFIRNGEEGAAWVEELLAKHGVAIESLGSLLDFGCGCGRVLRQWKRLTDVRVLGADYNPYLVAWCRRHLPFTRLELVQPDMSTLFPPASVDLIYAMSVFTHLTEDDQSACMSEFMRLLKPGGLLLLTVGGSTKLDKMSPEERARFDAGEMVVRHADAAGSNLCITYTPEPYVRRVLGAEFEVLDIVPGGAREIRQDAILLRKPD